jgi:hypothetical protein
MTDALAATLPTDEFFARAAKAFTLDVPASTIPASRRAAAIISPIR